MPNTKVKARGLDINTPVIGEALIYQWPNTPMTTSASLSTSEFWDWSDWDITISWTVTLTRDMYYNNLEIPTGQILNPNWYRVFIKWTLTWAGKIQRNGNNWWNGTWVTWWVGATALNQWSLNAELWWVTWPNWWLWDWYTWTSWTSSNPSYSNINWVTWWVWASSPSATWWASWPAWTSTRWVLYNVWSLQKYFELIWPASFSINVTQYKWIAVSWSWWGWGWYSTWSNSWWWGWWSWGNWWLIWLWVNNINWTGTFESKGWVWGNGWLPTWWPWIWGWGWGGNGWIVVVIYKTKTSIWSTTLTWWAGWTWGWSWSTGNTWELIEINL